MNPSSGRSWERGPEPDDRPPGLVRDPEDFVEGERGDPELVPHGEVPVVIRVEEGERPVRGAVVQRVDRAEERGPAGVRRIELRERKDRGDRCDEDTIGHYCRGQ